MDNTKPTWERFSDHVDPSKYKVDDNNKDAYVVEVDHLIFNAYTGEKRTKAQRICLNESMYRLFLKRNNGGYRHFVLLHDPTEKKAPVKRTTKKTTK